MTAARASTVTAAEAAPTRLTGFRASALLAAASAASIIANYAFLVAAGRILGTTDYGALAALLGLLAVVLIPAGALQMAVSREVARRRALEGDPEAYGFGRAVLRWALVATVPLVALALALAPAASSVLGVESIGVVLLAQSTLATALVLPVAMGVLQGIQRFRSLALLYVFPWPLRLGLLAAAAAAGYRLGGAVLATVASALAAALVAVALIRAPAHRPSSDLQPGPFLRYLGLVALGLVGIALLTHADLLVVKARFPDEEAGAYAAASAFARVGFFLPGALLSVLFPRTASRQARGEATEDILGRSLLATAGFCGLLALFYAASGVGLVVVSFGPGFAEGGEILAPFALATGLFSLANVLVGYHLSRRETRYAWIVAAGVGLQVLVLSLVPNTLSGVVWTNVALGLGLLTLHELLVASSAPALRAGMHRIGTAVAGVRRLLPEALLVVGAATALVVGLFWPVVIHLGSTVIGSPGSDSTGSIAWIWQARHESGFHLLGTARHRLTGAPFGWEETNGLNLQWFLPYYPAYLVSYLVGEVTAFNLVTLAGYVLSALAMYAVVRYLGCAPPVAAWAAFGYVVFPWHLARAEHASLVHLEVLPLLVLALLAMTRRPTWSRACLVGLAVLASWLTSGYFGAMAAVTASAFGLGAALAAPSRRLLVAGGPALAGLVASAAVGIASLASGTGTGAGLKRAAGDLSIYGLRPLELVVPPSSSLVFGDRLVGFWEGRGHGSNPTETANYLGLLTMALALLWLVTAWRHRRMLPRALVATTLGLVSAFTVGLVFAAPSPILVFGHPLPTGSRLLWEVTAAFRVPSRWTPLLMTALLPLSALTLQGIWRRFQAGGKRRRLVALGAVVAACAFSALELLVEPGESRYRAAPVPPEYEAVEKLPPGILAEYPLGYSDIYRLWQRRHGRPLLNGAPSGTVPDQARLILLDPTQPGTAEALALLGVTAVAIHPDASVDAEVAPTDPAGHPGYKLIGRYPGGASVWQVTAEPAPAFVTLPGGFGKPRKTPSGSVLYPLTSPSGVGALEVRARQAGIVRLSFLAQPPGKAQQVLRVADAEQEVAFALRRPTRVSLRVAIPRGLSRLLMKTDPPATSERDAILVSSLQAVSASGPPALRAEPVSPDPGF